MDSLDDNFEKWFLEAKKTSYIVDSDIDTALEDPVCAYHMLMECWDESMADTGKLTQKVIRNILNKNNK